MDVYSFFNYSRRFGYHWEKEDYIILGTAFFLLFILEYGLKKYRPDMEAKKRKSIIGAAVGILLIIALMVRYAVL